MVLPAVPEAGVPEISPCELIASPAGSGGTTENKEGEVPETIGLIGCSACPSKSVSELTPKEKVVGEPATTAIEIEFGEDGCDASEIPAPLATLTTKEPVEGLLGLISIE